MEIQITGTVDVAGMTESQFREQITKLLSEAGMYNISLEFESEEEMAPQPDSGDIFIVDCPSHGWDVSAGCKFLGNYPELDVVERTIRDWMERHQYWPNVWMVNDHGNVSLYKMRES